jgi:hypothetical protein
MPMMAMTTRSSMSVNAPEAQHWCRREAVGQFSKASFTSRKIVSAPEVLGRNPFRIVPESCHQESIARESAKEAAGITNWFAPPGAEADGTPAENSGEPRACVSKRKRTAVRGTFR